MRFRPWPFKLSETGTGTRAQAGTTTSFPAALRGTDAHEWGVTDGQWAVYLNNKFQLDGRDENGYVGIAWCFGLHDRPFPARAVWGEVRFCRYRFPYRRLRIQRDQWHGGLGYRSTV